MVNESLIEYLKTALGIEDKNDEDGDEIRDDIRALFDYNKEGNPFEDDGKTTEGIIDAIEKVKILDPACGSGAFPMGILHKLVLALHKLDPDNKIWQKRLLERVPAEIREETEKSLRNKPLDYVRKLGLIENCIYGVDIQEIAIQISKLRFFISLLVEQEIDDTKSNRDVRPLPNLETKFVAANTLIGLGKLPEELIDSEITNLSRKLFDLREEIFYSNSRRLKQTLEEKEEKLRENIEQALQDKYHKVIRMKIKKLEIEANELNKTLLQLKNEPEEIETVVTTNLFGERETKKIHKTKEKINSLTRRLNDCYKQIEELKNPQSDTSTAIAHKIASWDPFDQNTHADWFDPEWMFGIRDGFDIVIGNPPYVRADHPSVVDVRKQIMQSNQYITLYEKWDLMVPFYEKSLLLLKENGLNTFIASNSITTSKFSYRLQDWVIKNYKVFSIDHFEDNMQIFEAGVVPVITIIQKTKNKVTPHKIYRTNEFPNINRIVEVDTTDLTNLRERIFKKSFSGHFYPNIKTALLGDICYLSVGMVINSDEISAAGEFTKVDLISETKNKINSKPYIEGKNLKRYCIEKIKYLEWNTKRVPSKLRRPTFPALYKGEKIFRGRVTEGTFDDSGILCNDSIVVFKRFIDLKNVKERSISVSISKNNIIGKGSKTSSQVEKRRKELEELSKNYLLKYLLAVINSKYAIAYLNNFRKHRLVNYFYLDDFRNYPIPELSLEKQEVFVKLVDKILLAKKQNSQADTKHLEDKIDIMVYKLYELTYEEVKIIDPAFALTEKEYEKFEIE
ncbi:putative type iis restriction /modification enzyme, n-terminal half [hydrocarbon metagenome]|uniref:site-specific DNA-methyltransferase (adenine-specific) n=1 Tax=hydrocarbon metagenome TaxID=938273 RepID=A0A0W8FZS7_9ZZZZ